MKFVNRLNRLVSLVLNTREAIHLAPNEVSRTVEDFEWSGNRQIDKLLRSGAIQMGQNADADATRG